jgi:hypothetical protein
MSKTMRKRGLHLLERHIRSFDPDAPTARERLEEMLGDEFTQQLLRALTDRSIDVTDTHLVLNDDL